MVSVLKATAKLSMRDVPKAIRRIRGSWAQSAALCLRQSLSSHKEKKLSQPCKPVRELRRSIDLKEAAIHTPCSAPHTVAGLCKAS